MRKILQFNTFAGLNFQENHCELSHAGLGSVLTENPILSYDRINLERERLCNLLDCKKEELSMCKPSSWMYHKTQVEIAEIRRRLK